MEGPTRRIPRVLEAPCIGSPALWGVGLWRASGSWRPPLYRRPVLRVRGPGAGCPGHEGDEANLLFRPEHIDPYHLEAYLGYMTYNISCRYICKEDGSTQ